MKYLRQFLAIFKTECLFTYIKDGRRGLLLFFAATIYLLLFGLLYQQGVINHIPTAILDQNNTATSRAFVEDVADSHRFDVKYYALNQENLLQFMDTHHDWVAFEIPPHFERDIKRGDGSDVLMLIDGSNLVITSVSSIGSIEIAKAFSDQQATKLFQRDLSQTPSQADHKVKPIGVNYRITGNSTLSYLNFFVLGLALAAFQQGVLLSSAASILYRRQYRLPLERTMNPLYRLFCKLFPYWLSSMLGMAVMIGSAIYFLHLPTEAATFWPLFALSGGFSFLLSALAMWISGFSISELTFTRLSVFYTVPAFILSGFTWPLEAMPLWVQYLAKCSPLTYVANDFRNFYLNGYSPDIMVHAWGLFLAGIPFFIMAAYLYQRKVRRHFKQVDETYREKQQDLI